MGEATRRPLKGKIYRSIFQREESQTSTVSLRRFGSAADPLFLCLPNHLRFTSGVHGRDPLFWSSIRAASEGANKSPRVGQV